MDKKIIDKVAQLLGRKPRGLQAIAVSDANNQPAVIRVASLVDDKPFPTLFWLVSREINYAIDRLEGAGLIRELQAVVDGDAELLAVLKQDHLAYIELRNSLMSDDIRQRLQALGYYGALQQKGIGGIADYSRIRCLHTYYAAHMVQPNTIGKMLDKRFPNLCRGDIKYPDNASGQVANI